MKERRSLQRGFQQSIARRIRMHTGDMLEPAICSAFKSAAKKFHLIKNRRKEAEYVMLIRHQAVESSYRLACLHDIGRVCAVAGFRIAHSLAWGGHVYIDDLISDQSLRSLDRGEALIHWVAAFGRSQRCAELHLDSGVQWHGAHRFYLRRRMDITCYHFKLTL